MSGSAGALQVKEGSAGVKDTRGMEIGHAFAGRTTLIVPPNGKLAEPIGVSPIEKVDKALEAVQCLAGECRCADTPPNGSDRVEMRVRAPIDRRRDRRHLQRAGHRESQAPARALHRDVSVKGDVAQRPLCHRRRLRTTNARCRAASSGTSVGRYRSPGQPAEARVDFRGRRR